jgi:hypothetical protein
VAASVAWALTINSYSPLTIHYKSKIEERKYRSPFAILLSKNYFRRTKVSHASLFVNDQAKAYDFYINKLGFNVHTDVKMENGFRWLTITPPEQPDLEILLCLLP